MDFNFLPSTTVERGACRICRLRASLPRENRHGPDGQLAVEAGPISVFFPLNGAANISLLQIEDDEAIG